MNVRHFDPEGRLLLAVEDVTRLRELEDERRRSQKMEAIGHLAAGIAHDFNNLMASSMLQASLLLEALPTGTPGHGTPRGSLRRRSRPLT